MKKLFLLICGALVYLFTQKENTSVLFSLIHKGLVIKGNIKHMQIKEGQHVTVTANLKTKKGNAAGYEKGSASWESSNGDFVDVVQNPDNELEATVYGVNGSTNASALITFRCDGDSDADEEHEIIGTLDVVCTQGDAVVVDLQASKPVDDSNDTKDDDASNDTKTDDVNIKEENSEEK